MRAFDESGRGTAINRCTSNNLKFADDVAAVTGSEQNLQTTLELVIEASNKMGM